MVAYLQKSEGSEGFHQIIDFLNASHIQYALTENPTIYVSFIKQFWRTTTAGTSANGEVELTATIDGQVKTITEASLRRHLKLEDNGGVTTLPNSEIFEQLALMGRRRSVSTGSGRVSTASRTVSTADDSTASELGSTSCVEGQKQRGKVIMQESEPPKKVKKRVQVQMSMDEELAKKVFEEEQAKAMVEQEQERINFESDPAVLRYHAQLNRPYSVAEVRKNKVMYLKNQGGYKINYFKGMKYEYIIPIFEKVWDQIQSFAPMDFEKEKDSVEKGSRKKSLARKRAGEMQSEESTKRQKIEDDVEKEELKAYLDLVLREEFAMEIKSLATKYPIVDWKTHVLTENFMYYQIFRADGSSKNYKIFSEMLDDFDRQVGDLKILFEPDEEDEVWRNQHEYNLISWRLFDSCGIHILLMNKGIAIHMMIEKEYPLTQEMLSKMLSRKLDGI
ncbi:hypothetical protein Tco_0164279 [Tanacetum coccineum]